MSQSRHNSESLLGFSGQPLDTDGGFQMCTYKAILETQSGEYVAEVEVTGTTDVVVYNGRAFMYTESPGGVYTEVDFLTIDTRPSESK